MFWKKKKLNVASKQALILKVYLSGSMVMLSDKLSIPVARAGIQVFILGMADMIRQFESLDWEKFIAIYESALSEYKLLPLIPVAAFVERVGLIASKNADIDNVIRQGAQSIRMYIAERDANAPTDLFLAVLFAEQNESSFTELLGA